MLSDKTIEDWELIEWLAEAQDGFPLDPGDAVRVLSELQTLREREKQGSR